MNTELRSMARDTPWKIVCVRWIYPWYDTRGAHSQTSSYDHFIEYPCLWRVESIIKITTPNFSHLFQFSLIGWPDELGTEAI